MTKRFLFFLSAATLFAAEPNLMPWPAKIMLEEGALVIDRSFAVAIDKHDPRSDAAAARLIHNLSIASGIPFAGPPRPVLLIRCDSPGEPIQKFGEDESYRLEITDQRATLSAPNPLGVIRGLATFEQLVTVSPQGFIVPAVVIADKPRFPWRGLNLDVARHWMPLEVVRRTLEGMAAVKLNVFHWHLSDDQGFRIESKRYPKLHQLGSDGNYYTQDQVREVIAYARDRGIRVVPEFDMPAHTQSWLVGYPELSSEPGPYQIQRKWGVFDPVLDPTRESTYEFLDGFIGEMATLFPDVFFHVGGDEVNGEQWKRSPQVQDFMREHHFKDTAELQAYFTKRVQAIVAKHDKRMEGWDEVLAANPPKDIVIQAWRDQKQLADAARQGYAGILSAPYYLDHMEPASTGYAADPSAGLSAEERSRILGGEVCMWTEYVSTENVDSRIWPRTASIAERLWSPEEIKDVASMYRRLGAVSHLDNYLPMLHRIAGSDDIGPLKVFGDALRAGDLDARDATNKYAQQTPLNRIVDAARPESDTARQFAALVDRMDIVALRVWLTAWRDNDAKLQPILTKSFLASEDAPISKELSRVGSVGLEALDYIEHHQHAPQAWLDEQRAFLQQAGKMHLELWLAVVPPVQILVEKAK